ncbi:hypothetical protein EC957_006068 [Mortierella hygrophila]|uniref:Uncharacterized protein n=1 Tax=Mortierella hygrophila TaxID=979708 RepID=A0A9P6EZX6_9FUNG|nr:hypothetical protein EC957_006068 [Mortierella hygrophila]
MRDNRRIVFSLLGIYRNASSPEMKVSMTQSIQAIAYKTVMNETTKSRTTTTRIGPRRDLISSIPIPKSTNNTDANAEMRETIATNVTDNDAREPWKQQQSEKEDEGKGTNEEQQQQEEANNDDDDGDDDDVGDYFPSPKLPPLAPREPSHEHQHFLFMSSYSFNNNTTNINIEQGAAHVPDCDTNPNVGDEICERTDLALNHRQNQNQQQQRRQRQECLELDLEMDEWRSREQDEQGEGDQSDFSDFNDFSEEEQNQLFEEDRGELVDEDEDSEMWKEGGNKSGFSPYLPTHNQVSKE